MNVGEDDTLEDIGANIIVTVTPDHEASSSEISPKRCDPEIDIFDRIANKLLRSGLMLTALELHAELIERDRELPRLREFFDNPHNFEKRTNLSHLGHQRNESNSNSMAAADGEGRNHADLSSEKTFDSFDLTHYSDDHQDDDSNNQDAAGGGNERIAILEYELRKARQTIDSLRASLTLSTAVDCSSETKTNSTTKLQNAIENDQATRPSTNFDDQNNLLSNKPETIDCFDSIAIESSGNNTSFFDRVSCHDYYSRGCGDGDSCPGEDDHRIRRFIPSTAAAAAQNIENIFDDYPVTASNANRIFTRTASSSSSNHHLHHHHHLHPLHHHQSSATTMMMIKPHEKRAINYLINEYLMSNGYRLTSITFCDENADQDFDKWEDVGLNTEPPPDLLRLYRYFWQNCSSLLQQQQQQQPQQHANSNIATSIDRGKMARGENQAANE